jgi:PAS domain S-box-containing protein
VLYILVIERIEITFAKAEVVYCIKEVCFPLSVIACKCIGISAEIEVSFRIIFKIYEGKLSKKHGRTKVCVLFCRNFIQALYRVNDTLKNSLRILAVALIYFLTARFSLLLQFDNSNSSPVWPPSGIALAALIIFGRKFWPAIFIGAFSANLVAFISNNVAGVPTAIATSLCIATGNTLEALTGNYLLKNKNYILGISRHSTELESAGWFQRVNNVFWFLYTSLIMCIVGAVIGPASVYLAAIINQENFMNVSFTWWVGDVSGVLVTTPLLLAWFKPATEKKSMNLEPIAHPLAQSRIQSQELIETVALFLAITIMSGIIFYGWFTDSFTLSRAFFIIPFMVWAGLRFGLRIITSAIALTAAISVLGTVHGHGPFVDKILNESLITASAFIAIVSVTSLALQAVLSERKQTENALRLAQNQLKSLVTAGTVKIEDFEGRIKNLQSVIQRFGQLDFSVKAPTSDKNDELDSIATGLNKMSEEMEALRTAEKFYVKNIRETEERFRLLVENIKDYAIFMMDANGNISSWNKGAEQLKGYTAQEILGKHYSIFYTPEELKNNEPAYNLKMAREKGNHRTEGWRLKKDGSTFFANLSITALYDNHGHVKGFAKITRDVTKQKESEELLRESEAQVQSILRNAPDAVIVIDKEGKITFWNSKAESIFGWNAGEVLGKYLHQTIIPERYRKEHVAGLDKYLKTGEGPVLNKTIEMPALQRNGNEFFVHLSISPTSYKNEPFFIGFLSDITERKKIETELMHKQEEIEKSRQFLLDSQSVGKIGSWERDLRDNTITASPEYFKMLDIIPDAHNQTSFKEFLSRVHPDDKQRVKETIESINQDGGHYDIEYRVVQKDGQQRIIWAKGKAVHNEEGNPLLFRGTTQDITDRKEAENKLALLAEELSRSNKELEQFAYVASHDLQEPLRIVTSYVQLLQRRFTKNIDSETNEFMNFIVEAVGRMRSLIQDLLDYSRVGTQIKPFIKTDLNNAVNIALDNLAASVTESGAQVTADPLPQVMADDSQMVRLFQNLISNAIKFRSEKTPQIKISGEEKKNEYLFTVKDNGIGISAEYKERIFVIFQRLNDRSKYPGTGIGLAICKKIVELHGGRIWMEPRRGGGSAFYFTIKK